MNASRTIAAATCSPVAVGAVCGLAWAAGLRGFMTQVTQEPSTVTWVGTFGWILLPGAVIGALLGEAEHIRFTTGILAVAGWSGRLSCSPFR